MLTLSIPTRYASLRHCAVLRSQPQQQRNEAVAKKQTAYDREIWLHRHGPL